jgi:2-oxoglutarate dehydrogenase complex dehydrogenase (E1) component-like enzyme
MTLDEFQGVNVGYILELFERHRHDPGAVDDATRDEFCRWKPNESSPPSASSAIEPNELQRTVGAANLAESLRRYRQLAATVDPLGCPQSECPP